MSDNDNDGQMIFGDFGSLKLPDIRLTGEEKPWKNLTQENCPSQGSNPGPLRDRCACYHLAHSGGHLFIIIVILQFINKLSRYYEYHQFADVYLKLVQWDLIDPHD